MWRTLRAFAWMRWRVLMNSLERTTARDTIERFSLAIEQIGPLIAFGLLAPSALALAAIGGYAGYWLPSSERVITFDAIRLLLLVSSGLSIVGPILMPTLERTSAVRLLLLPIPRGTLYLSQVSTTVSDPWIILVIPIVMAMPVGAAIAGAFAVAASTLVAGVLLLVVLAGLSALSTLLLHLIVRDRRRGEWLALLIVVIPVLFMLPGLMNASQTREQRRAERAAAAERRQLGEESTGEYALRVGQRGLALLPSELFATAARAPSTGGAGGVALSLVGLALCGALVHGLGVVTFGRLLSSPIAGGQRRAGGTAGRMVRIPGLSRASAAVAHAHLRLATRTPRGRSTLLSPLLVFTVLAFVMSRRENLESQFAGGIGVAAFGSSICLLSILPFAMNQFAIDRAGLTLSMLAPIETRDLLVGKAVGNAVIVGGPALLSVLIAYVIFREGPLALWMCVPTALAATYALMAPGAAALSAIFPRHVDLNSVGRGSNAHGMAGALGLFLFLAAGLPGVLIAMVSILVLERPTVALILMIAWFGIAVVVSRWLFRPAAAVFDRRRENLGLVAS